jgi:sec-independent protein translocase protein TatB
VFDLNISKLLVLGVIALVIFGPDQLPRLAQQAGKALRDLRHIAENAKADLTEGLGPEFRDFDINDLHPKNFVRKHLWEGFESDGANGAGTATAANGTATAANGTAPFHEPTAAQANGISVLAPGESPPYDSEAT